MGYDAFISYSHAGDGRLAPAVQTGLQRLARPWYRRWALRVFRDDTGLSVNPHLWASIAAAMDDANWFVLLASPEAAASPWVNREIDYWCAHKDPDHILPVLTDGSLVWDDARSDYDPGQSSALPAALAGRFAGEPRHLDLRWARDEEQLDLRHSRFREAVADLAAPMHGIAKEELESEDVRRHRRAVGLARAGLAVVLASAAVLASVFAVTNAHRANAQAARARTSATQARQAENVASQRAVEAESARNAEASSAARAVQAGDRARAEAANAAEQQKVAEAANVSAQQEATNARRAEGDRAAEAERARREAARADTAADNAEASARQATLSAADARRQADAARASALEAEARRVEAEHQKDRADTQTAIAKTQTAEVTRQRDLVLVRGMAANALAESATSGGLDTALVLAAEASQRSDDVRVRDALLQTLQKRPPNLVRFLSGHRGATSSLFVAPDFSSMVTGGDGPLECSPYCPNLLRLPEGTPVPLPSLGGPSIAIPGYSGDGRRIAGTAFGGVAVVDTTSGQFLYKLPGIGASQLALDGHGDRLAAWPAALSNEIVIRNLATGASVTFAPASPSIEFLVLSPDGSRLATSSTVGPPFEPASDAHEIRQYDTATGDELTNPVIAHHGAAQTSLRYESTPAGLQLVSIGGGRPSTEAAVVWSAATMARITTYPVPGLEPTEEVVKMSRDRTRLLTVEGQLGAPEGVIRVRDASAGDVLGDPMTVGTTFFTPGTAADFLDAAGTQIVSVGDGGDVLILAPVTVEPARTSVTLAGAPTGGLRAISPDGATVAVAKGAKVDLLDARSGARIGTLPHAKTNIVYSFSFNRTGSQLAATAGDLFAPEPAELLGWDIGSRSLRLRREIDDPGEVAFSPDGRVFMLTTITFAGSTLLDASTGDTIWRSAGAEEAFFTGFTGDSRRAIFAGFSAPAFAIDTHTGARAPVPFAQADLDWSRNIDPPYSADGGLVALRTSSTDVTIFEVATERAVSQITVDSDVFSIELTPDGRTLIGLNVDNSGSTTIQLYDVVSGLAIGAPFTDVAPLFESTPDGRELVAFDFAGHVDRIRITPDTWRAEACALVGRDLTAEEWHRFIGEQLPQDTTCS